MLESNLKILLIKKKITITELAKLTGISRGYLSNLANNKIKDFKKDYLIKICEVLQCNIGDLLDFESNNFKSS